MGQVSKHYAPYHLNFLSKHGIRNLFKSVGFRKCEIRTPGRLDVEIVANALKRGENVQLSKFESQLLNSDQETRDSFQKIFGRKRLKLTRMGDSDKIA